MAFYDWNQDGNKDFTDDFIEYNIYQESTGQDKKSSYTPSSGGGISGFGVAVCVAAGLVGQAALYTALDIDVENVPVVIMLVLWVVISSIAAVIADKIGL